jgi:hypothetical protein
MKLLHGRKRTILITAAAALAISGITVADPVDMFGSGSASAPASAVSPADPDAAPEGEDTSLQEENVTSDVVQAAANSKRSACGSEPIPAFNLTVGTGAEVSVPIPSGYLTHCTDGTGLRIRSETALYTAAPSLIGAVKGKACNWRIDFAYRDTSNRLYKTVKGKTHQACDFTAGVRVDMKNKKFRAGTTCAVLWISGKKIGSQCHYLTK